MPNTKKPKTLARRRGKIMHESALQLLLPLFDSPAPSRPRGDGKRLLQMNDQSIEYQLQRSRRRTIGFAIDERGLTVTAPRWVTLADIEQSLVERGQWIVRKTIEWRDYLARRERSAIRWEHGAAVRFLGESLTMRLTQPTSQQGSQQQTIASSRASIVKVNAQLLVTLPLVTLPQGSGGEPMKTLVQTWLQQQARAVFEPRLRHFGEQLGKQPTRWALSSARTRWGSCAPDGSIRLNWRLIHYSMDIIDYIVAHEVAHLREMNHGPRFWAIVADLFPNYQQARDWLRQVPT